MTETAPAQILWPAQGQALERAEGASDRRTAAASPPRPEARGAVPLGQSCSPSPSARCGSRSASARASICSGRPSTIETSASSAASPSSTAWRPCLGRSRIVASRRSASMTATPATVLAWLPDRSIGRIFLLFPDPWPKKRQLKRRLLVAGDGRGSWRACWSPGGELRFASDDGDYAAQALLLMRQSGVFDLAGGAAADWRERPADWPETRYERKALGRRPQVDLSAVRADLSASRATPDSAKPA